MSEIHFDVDMKFIEGSGAVKARADVRFEMLGGSLVLRSFSVIEQNGKPPWVGFPQKQGKTPGKYFPIVEADGELRKAIIQEILDIYEGSKTAP